jgi:hypothetical protein
MVGALLAFALAAAQVPDTSTYKDGQTARLIAQARARHRIQDTLVHDYEALVRTRVDAGFGRSRFARILPIVAMETAAQVTWAQPNDLRVRVVGVRSASAIRGAKVEGTFSNPWFVPRGFGDSIRFLDEGIPDTPALHPLAPGSEAYYRYAIFDSVTMEIPGRRVRAVGIRVEPKRSGPSLVAGNLWLDAETAEIVRLTLTFLGEYLWSEPDTSTAADSAKARKENSQASRILRIDAELEYALHESRFWMPYRQLVTLTVDIPWFISARIPVRFITDFSDYRINTGVVPHFTVALQLEDSTRSAARCRRRSADTLCSRNRSDRGRDKTGYTRSELWKGGRWELEMPPRDSISGYAWPDELALRPDPATEQMIRETAATLARIEHDLPAEWVGRQAIGPAFERVSDLFRFNRVQGVSLGAGLQVQTGGFSSLLGSARFGLSDRLPTGSLTFRRDAPGGRLDLSAWRSVREVEPWTRGATVGNSLNAALAGHDDADYYLSLGSGLSFSGNTGAVQDAEIELRFERARSMSTRSRSALNDWLGGSGQLPPNPPVLEGDYLTAAFSRLSLWGPLEARYGLEGTTSVTGRASNVTAGRIWGSAKMRFDLAGRGGTLSLRGGALTGDDVPQLLFRVGGPESVRGYNYGTRVGRAAWAAQLDVALTRNSIISPVAFADAGNIAGSGKPLMSAGGGLSFFSGFMRFNLAKGLAPRTPARFDLLFRAAR